MRARTKKYLLTSSAITIAGLAAVYYLLPFCVSKPDIAPPTSTAVYDRHGELLGYVAGADDYRCEPLRQLPPQLARALVAIEDNRFYSHGGIDLIAITRALWHHLRGQQGGGASTITMQVAKLYNPPSPRTWRTKLKEALQARRLEMSHSKEELLLAYLNRADFSNLCRGAECAARFYFGCSAAELTPAQAALLAGMVQAPTRLNPLRHPKAALARRNRILTDLGEDCSAPLGASAHPISAPPSAAGHPGKLTLDAELQRRVTTIARQELANLRGRNVSQAAVVVADNRTGEVLVALPAAHPESERGGALNGTSTPRSAGSTLKPFIFLMAFEHGDYPGTVVADIPTQYRSADGIQAPGNYNDRYLGPISMRQALACSQNIPAMQALDRAGGAEKALEQLRKLGFQVPGTAAQYGLGLAIGNAHVTLMELVQAYSTLARNGCKLPLQQRLPLQPATAMPLLPAIHSYRIAHILSDRSARAATFGPAPALSFPYRVAAKTGTSSNYRDNWCIGFTAEYTVGVWVGNFDNTAMRNISGVSGAGPIFHRVLSLLHENTPATFPEQPEQLYPLEIDTRTGTAATAQTPAECRTTELVTADEQAAMPTPKLDERGRAILDSSYAEWYAGAGLSHLYALESAAPSGRRPAILIPSPGTTMVLSPALPRNGRFAELRSTLPAATTTWHCDTLPIIQQGGKWYAVLRPGTHTLRATAPPDLSAQSTFHVVENRQVSPHKKSGQP